MTPADFLAARQGLGMSQARLAHVLGVGEHAVQSWEVGRRPIPQWAENMLALLRDRRRGVMESYPAITRPERAQKGARDADLLDRQLRAFERAQAGAQKGASK